MFGSRRGRAAVAVGAARAWRLIAAACTCAGASWSRGARGLVAAGVRRGQPVHDLVLAGGARVHAAGGAAAPRRCCSSPGRGVPGRSRDLLWWAVSRRPGAADPVLRRLSDRRRGSAPARTGCAAAPRHRLRRPGRRRGAAHPPRRCRGCDNPALFITGQPLARRLQQVPVDLRVSTRCTSARSCATGCSAAARAGGGRDRAAGRSGPARASCAAPGIAAALAGVVLIVPLLLALVGHDDYIARGLMPAWPPLAIVIAAACTTRGAQIPGAALVVVLVASFVWAEVRDRRQTPATSGLTGAASRRRSGRAPAPGRSSPTPGSSRPGRCRSTCAGSRGRDRASRRPPSPTPAAGHRRRARRHRQRGRERGRGCRRHAPHLRARRRRVPGRPLPVAGPGVDRPRPRRWRRRRPAAPAPWSGCAPTVGDDPAGFRLSW